MDRDRLELSADKRSVNSRGALKGEFRGRGYITSDEDDGRYISDMSTPDYNKVIEGPKMLMHPPVRRFLDIADLFPEDWSGQEVEFEITVTAKRVSTDAPGYKPRNRTTPPERNIHSESTSRWEEERRGVRSKTLPGYGGRPVRRIIVGTVASDPSG